MLCSYNCINVLFHNNNDIVSTREKIAQLCYDKFNLFDPYFFVSLIFTYIYRTAGARIASVALVLLILSCYLLYNTKKFNYLNVSFNKSFYVIGFVLFITQMFSWVLEKSDRILITNYLDYEATGVYSVGYQFGMVLLMIQIAISRAWMPRIIENFKRAIIIVFNPI